MTEAKKFSVQEIQVALRQLDASVDTDWTTNGAPAMERVSALLGVEPGAVKRVDVTSAAPDLTRDTFAAWVGALDDDERSQSQDDGVGDEFEEETVDATRARFNDQLAKMQAQADERQEDINDRQQDLNKLQAEIDRVTKERDELAKPSPVTSIKDHLDAGFRRRLEAAGQSPVKQVSELDNSLRSRRRSETRPAPQAPAKT